MILKKFFFEWGLKLPIQFWEYKEMLCCKKKKKGRGKLTSDIVLLQSRDTCSSKFALGEQNEAGQRLAEFCQENMLVIANTLFLQHKRWFYTWTSPDGKYKIRLIIVFAAKGGEAPYSQQKQDQKLTVAQIMNSLLPDSDLNWRKWGKPLVFRYDLNQIPYDYRVEVRNRFNGLDLIECLMNYGQRLVTLYRRQGLRPSPRKRNAKRQNSCLRRPYKWLRNDKKQRAKEKRKHIPIQLQSCKEQQGEIRKPSSVISAKK